MSCSKPMPPSILDFLSYLKRDELERLSIICRPLNIFVERYFRTKPYRVFDHLIIRRGSYVLFNNGVQWHPSRKDYTVQQFLGGQTCSIDKSKCDSDEYTYYSFSKMHPYLGPTIGINNIIIYIAGDLIYNSKHIAEMESIAYLWRNRNIAISNANDKWYGRTAVQDFKPILNSPTILQCRKLYMMNAHFSFKDYKILYNVQILGILYAYEEEIDPNYWSKFFDQPGVKPIVALRYFQCKNVDNLIDHLSKVFSSAVVPSPFKIVLEHIGEPLTEFRKTNKTSYEKLQLKKGIPLECRGENFDDRCYTLERSSF